MFAAVYAAEGTSPGTLAAVAREFSPRIEIPTCTEGRVVTLDLSGLARLFGDARTIGQELRRTAADRGVQVRVAIAATRTAARLLVAVGSRQYAVGRKNTEVSKRTLRTAHCLPPTDTDIIVIEPGAEGAALAPLPIALLQHLDPEADLQTIRRWGLQCLGDLAALPSDALAARLGQDGVRWQRLARGEDPRPLVPAVLEERFEQALDLEWPIEDLEPLSFVLGRLIEPLSAHLDRRGRGAAVLHVRLHLVTRVVYERSLQLPAPMRDPRTLRTLLMLDLESHPPPAAIDRVVVAVDPTPGRIVQCSLLTRPLPSPEQISTLTARLTALMGEGRCGSPVASDSWQPGAFAMKPFAPLDTSAVHRDDTPRLRDTEVSHVPDVLGASVPRCVAVAIRRFRFPVPARVRVDSGQPERAMTDRRGLSGGRVEACAGPWRTAGGWWAGEAGGAGRASGAGGHWDRDEWDVTLADGATYRIFRERHTDAWFIDGIVD